MCWKGAATTSTRIATSKSPTRWCGCRRTETKRFEWEAGDVIYIPPNTIHQHFNADPDKPARLISCTNRIFKQIGLNTLDQIEDAPEYDAKVLLTDEVVRDYLRGTRR